MVVLDAIILFQLELDLPFGTLSMYLRVEALFQRKLVRLLLILAVLVSNGYAALAIELLRFPYLQLRSGTEFVLIGQKLAAEFLSSQQLALHAHILEVQVHVARVVAFSTQHGILA